MPAFTDWVGMVEGNASMYLASPRVAEKVTGRGHHAGGDGRGDDARHRLGLRRRGVRLRLGGDRRRAAAVRATSPIRFWAGRPAPTAAPRMSPTGPTG